MIYKYVYYLSVIIGVIKARSIIDDEPPGRVLQCHRECLQKVFTINQFIHIFLHSFNSIFRVPPRNSKLKPKSMVAHRLGL